MPHIRLIGLFLFMTAMIIALAAAMTQTSQIRFKRPHRQVSGSSFEPAPTTTPESTGKELEFISVPIIYPLGVVGFAGLLLWFVPAIGSTSTQRSKRKRRRKRRKK